MTSPSTDLEDDERRRIAEASLERQLAWIRAVEQKLTVLVAINVGLLGLFGAIVSSQPGEAAPSLACVALATTPFLCSLYQCARANYPQLKAPNISALFFGTISEYSREQYTDKFLALSSDEYMRDLLAQIHRNAEIASYKFGRVRCASGWLFAGTPTLTLAIAML